MMIVIGAVMVASAPLSAADDSGECSNLVVNFDDFSGGTALWSNNTSIAAPITLGPGTYDILLTSFDPGHGSGLHLDQLHESWFFTLDNGYVSPTTPDFDDSTNGVAIVAAGVTLASASQVTAFWAGQLPSPDSVHATVSFTCSRQTILASTSTTAATTTSLVGSSTSTTSVSTSAVSTSTTATSTTAAPLLPTTLPPETTSAPSTTETVGEIGGTTEENTELAFTGTNLNLALAGFALIAGGFGLVVLGAVHDRRRFATVES